MDLTAWDREFLEWLRIAPEDGRTSADVIDDIASALAQTPDICAGRRYHMADPSGDWCFTVTDVAPRKVSVQIGTATLTLARWRVEEARR